MHLVSAAAPNGPFPWGTFWAAVATLVGAAAIIVTIILWRLGAPRRLITYDVPVITSLLTAQLPKATVPAVKVAVLVNGDVVADPYFMELRVQSQNRRDIRASDFDQGEPLVFELGASIVGVVGNEGSLPIIEEAGGKTSGSVLAIYPRLLRRGDGFRSSLLLDGKPHVTVRNPLVNVDVQKQAARTRSAWRRSLLILTALTVLVLILSEIFHGTVGKVFGLISVPLFIGVLVSALAPEIEPINRGSGSRA